MKSYQCISLFLSLLLSFSSCNFLKKKGIVLDSSLPSTSTITQIPTTSTINQIPLSTISQVPYTTTGYYPSYSNYYNPYVLYTEPSSSELSAVNLDTNTVSQNLPQGGSQSTGYTKYSQASSQYYNPQYGTVTTSPVELIGTTSPQQPYYTSSTANQQSDLLGMLAMAALSKNADSTNALNSNLLNSLFGSNGVSSDGSVLTANTVTTNGQNTVANTVADMGSNASTDMTNNAVGTNYNSVTGEYSGQLSGINYSYN